MSVLSERGESRETLHLFSKPGKLVHRIRAHGIMSRIRLLHAWEALLVWKSQSSITPLSGGFVGIFQEGVTDVFDEVDEGSGD